MGNLPSSIKWLDRTTLSFVQIKDCKWLGFVLFLNRPYDWSSIPSVTVPFKSWSLDHGDFILLNGPMLSYRSGPDLTSWTSSLKKWDCKQVVPASLNLLARASAIWCHLPVLIWLGGPHQRQADGVAQSWFIRLQYCGLNKLLFFMKYKPRVFCYSNIEWTKTGGSLPLTPSTVFSVSWEVDTAQCMFRIIGRRPSQWSWRSFLAPFSRKKVSSLDKAG